MRGWWRGRLVAAVAAVAAVATGTATAAASAGASYADPAPRAVADLGVQAGFGRLLVDSAHGHVFVSEPQAGAVAVLDPQGRLTTTLSGLPGAWGLAIGGHYLYVAAQGGGYVARVDLTAPALSARVFAAGLPGPRWLAFAAGRLWVGTAPIATGESSVVAINPATGARRSFGGSFYGADFAVSPADPHALYMAEAESEPEPLHRYDLRAVPPAPTAANPRFWAGAWGNMVLSPDGSRLDAAVGANAGFPELCSQTLQPDGVTYPGADYPAGVATSATGLLATGLTGYNSPNLAVYRIGVTTPFWAATTTGSEQIRYGALGLSADGRTLYTGVDGPAPGGPALLIETYALPVAPAQRATDPCPAPSRGGTHHRSSRYTTVLRVRSKRHPRRPSAAFSLRLTLRPQHHRYSYTLSLSRLRCTGHANALALAFAGRRWAIRCAHRRVTRRSGTVGRRQRYVVRARAVHRRARHVLRRGVRHSLVLRPRR